MRTYVCVAGLPGTQYTGYSGRLAHYKNTNKSYLMFILLSGLEIYGRLHLCDGLCFGVCVCVCVYMCWGACVCMSVGCVCVCGIGFKRIQGVGPTIIGGPDISW